MVSTTFPPIILILESLCDVLYECMLNSTEKLQINQFLSYLIYTKDDLAIFSNYRPISIRPAMSKIFEKEMFNQVHAHFEVNKLYYNSQYVFRRNNSTEFAALELIDRILLDMDKGEIPFAICIDLSKAFDTLDHITLMHKLSYYGVQGTALTLFQSYLNNRKQYAKFDNVESDLDTLTTGVHQGSILGPLLFLIYMNDLNNVSSLFKTIMYADDTTLVGNLSNFDNKNNEKNARCEHARENGTRTVKQRWNFDYNRGITKA